MMERWRNSLTLGVAALVMACAAGPGAELGVGEFDDWDADDDGFVNEMEFGQNWVYNDEFGAWDTDASGFIEQDEWDIGVGDRDDEFGVWDTWDLDDDNRLTAGEFNRGSFTVFDENDDWLIDDDEWATGVGVW